MFALSFVSQGLKVRYQRREAASSTWQHVSFSQSSYLRKQQKHVFVLLTLCLPPTSETMMPWPRKCTNKIVKCLLSAWLTWSNTVAIAYFVFVPSLCLNINPGNNIQVWTLDLLFRVSQKSLKRCCLKMTFHLVKRELWRRTAFCWCRMEKLESDDRQRWGIRLALHLAGGCSTRSEDGPLTSSSPKLPSPVRLTWPLQMMQNLSSLTTQLTSIVVPAKLVVPAFIPRPRSRAGVLPFLTISMGCSSTKIVMSVALLTVITFFFPLSLSSGTIIFTLDWKEFTLSSLFFRNLLAECHQSFSLSHFLCKDSFARSWQQASLCSG